MGALEQERNKLIDLEKKQEEFLLNIRDVYELDEDYCDSTGAVEDCIYGGDITLEWSNSRDFDYIDDMIRCQQMLVRALELFEQGDKKLLHNANKALEALVRETRRIKKKR